MIRMRNAIAALMVVVGFFLANPIDAQIWRSYCEECRYSPNRFGFCRFNQDGYLFCFEYVADTFSGRTDCDVYNSCTAVLADGGGGGRDCWWTDLYGRCILAF